MSEMKKVIVTENDTVVDVDTGVVGTQQPQLERRFNLLSAMATGIVTGNTWTALGGAIIASLYNGGPPGIIYAFIAVSVFYWLIALSIAELTSAVPASGGVYHWANITGGERWGKACGFFAGWLNFFAWVFGVASNCTIVGQSMVYSYGLFHEDYVPQRWHVFIVHLIVCWFTGLLVMYGNKVLPLINKIGAFLLVGGWFVSTIVCAVMPGRAGNSHATSKFVWKEWQNDTGYSSNGFVFLAGMLNGAFAVGTPDCVTHIAEEIPQAGRNLPKVLLIQVSVGFITGLAYLISLCYSISDLEAIFLADSFSPLGDIYLQATGSRGATLGLLIIISLPIICACIGCQITAGRTLYALSRDSAAPFPNHIGVVSERFESPLYSTFACSVIATCLGAIYVGSTTAFNAFVGSFVLLTTASFLLAIGPHILRKRKSFRPGPFWMGKWGFFVNGMSCIYIIVSFVIYCFPFSLPVTVEGMNYTSVITVGFAILAGVWWLVRGRKHYQGAQFDIIDFSSYESKGTA